MSNKQPIALGVVALILVAGLLILMPPGKGKSEGLHWRSSAKNVAVDDRGFGIVGITAGATFWAEPHPLILEGEWLCFLFEQTGHARTTNVIIQYSIEGGGDSTWMLTRIPSGVSVCGQWRLAGWPVRIQVFADGQPETPYTHIDIHWWVSPEDMSGKLTEAP